MQLIRGRYLKQSTNFLNLIIKISILLLRCVTNSTNTLVRKSIISTALLLLALLCRRLSLILKTHFPLPFFFNFVTVSIDVLKLFMPLSSSTCSLDPLPTEVLKKCQPCLCPSITAIINNSLATGQVHVALQMTTITPVLKKSGWDAEYLSNYRPIANLPCLAKVLERVVVG